MTTSILAWHFTTKERRLRYGDCRLIEAGTTHTVNVAPECCKSGLHGSVDIIDALVYAPGPVLCRVHLSGVMDTQQDKIAATRRKYLAVVDISDELRAFSLWCALQVAHLWDAPQIVIYYLTTGDESIQDDARAAAWAAATAPTAATAARAAARAAARNTAWAAARDEQRSHLIKILPKKLTKE